MDGEMGRCNHEVSYKVRNAQLIGPISEFIDK